MVFFAGQNRVTPSVNSTVVDSAMLNPNTAVGNVLALIGPSAGGAPNTPLTFSNPSDASATLVSGDLCDAVVRAFAPSAELPGPAEVVCIRVNPALQATANLIDGQSAPVGVLTSTDYGARTLGIKFKVEAGTTSGQKVSISLGSQTVVGDNLGRQAFTVAYTGAQATANISVTNTAVTLSAPAGTAALTLALTPTMTVQSVVDAINSTAGFSATVVGAGAAKPVLNALDSCAPTDVRTAPYTINANLAAISDWLNSPACPFVTFTRAAAASGPPALTPWTYLTGGVDGVVTNTNWSNAFTTLQTVDCQWVVPVTSSAAVWAMADAHVQYMSGAGHSERRSIVGPAIGTTDIAALAMAVALNSGRTALTHLGGYDFNAAGALTLYPPYIVAAMVGGMLAGAAPGTPVTGKHLALQGMERKLRNPADTDALIAGGVLAVMQTRTGCEVVKSISTWLGDSRFDMVELSCGAALDFTVRAVREALKPLKGARADPSALGRAVSLTQGALRICATADPIGPGTIVGDAT